MKNSVTAVAILMGSTSDLPTMKDCADFLERMGVTFEMKVLSAHRTPDEVIEFSKAAGRNGFKVIVAGGGGAAHLPGLVASHTTLPVIGVPVALGPMQGLDALYSIVQMPKGVPVATMAIGNAWNAGVLAAQILSSSEGDSTVLRKKLEDYKEEMRKAVLSKGL